MQGGELTEEGDERAFTEGVGEAGVEGKGGVFAGQEFNPFRLDCPLVKEFRSNNPRLIVFVGGGDLCVS